MRVIGVKYFSAIVWWDARYNTIFGILVLARRRLAQIEEIYDSICRYFKM